MVYKNLLSWTSLSNIGQNKTVQTSYFWFFVVPIAAKFLDGLNRYLVFNIFGENIKFTIGLPFSWKLLFFGALFFTIGNLIYRIYCPSLIRDYKSFADFEAEGKTERELFKYLVKIINKYINNNKLLLTQSKEKELIEFLSYNLRYSAKSENPDRSVSENRYQFFSHTVSFNEIKEKVNSMVLQTDATVMSKSITFWEMRDFEDRINKIARIMTFSFYLLGILISIAIIIQNTIFVINSILAS